MTLTTRLLTVPLVILTGVACAAGGPPREPAKISSRVSAELLELHEAYRAAQSRGETLATERSHLRVVDDRVIIDAVAAGDTPALEADLVLRRPAAFGRVVSGELPIAAIPRLESLTSLAFVRPSMPSHGPAPRPTPNLR
jgi:hypothetical protein